MEEARNALEAVEHVSNYIKADPAIYHNFSYFIEGWGWDHTRWPAEQWPTTEEMESDPFVRGRQVVLQSKDGHALWVSQRVLDAMAPIPAHVEGGHIVRDETGNPTGVFLDNAQDLVPRPPPTEKQLLKRWSIMVRDAHAVGLTSVHDAGFSPVSLKFFECQAKNNNLPLRVYGMRYFDESGPYWGNTSAKIIAAGNNRLTSRSVKIFGDGALRSGGAALYEPYSDNPETRGFMRLSTKVLDEIIPNFLRDGWQVNIHAIGDRANAIILDAFENALKDTNVTALRPRLEHAQFMRKQDMTRLGKLGVIASVQPTHAISDMWYAESRLGPERVKGLYAFRSIIDEGARITLGSDAPVETINPLSGFYAAITRVSPEGQSPHGPDGWFPEQRISRKEALRGITIDPAYASFTDNILGSIVPGKRADYVVFSQDIMEVPADQVLKTKVLATVMDGKAVYGAL
ncbi:amidohydrolase 3 [Thelephora terrestris]|uniref:Amidohydrolase 3 n=1 Tax=Thelephora terrestris TaxID=56493 RepID=A0A9P6HQP0_9AGAM|nr:amidohydrolase 3 [Thelephora terrestris]